MFLCSIRKLNWSLDELKQIAKVRRIKGYKKISIERLLCALTESESVESEKNLDKKIREYFNKLRDRFLKLKIKEIWR